MGIGGGFVTARNVCVNMVQGIVSPCGGEDLMVKFRSNTSKVCLVKVPSYNKDTVHFFDHVTTDGIIQTCIALFEFASGGM